MYRDAHAWADGKEAKRRRKPSKALSELSAMRLDRSRAMRFRPAERPPRKLRSEVTARIWTMRRRKRTEARVMAARSMVGGAILFATRTDRSEMAVQVLIFSP